MSARCDDLLAGARVEVINLLFTLIFEAADHIGPERSLATSETDGSAALQSVTSG